MSSNAVAAVRANLTNWQHSEEQQDVMINPLRCNAGTDKSVCATFALPAPRKLLVSETGQMWHRHSCLCRRLAVCRGTT